MIRPATAEDTIHIAALLAADVLRRDREGPPDDPAYALAFAEIAADRRSKILVAEEGGDVVGVAHVTVTPNLTCLGSRRAQVESLHVAEAYRGRGIGRALVAAAVDHARAAGCRFLQLTSDHRRPDAYRFFISLGFEDSHVGFKLDLAGEDPVRPGSV